MAKTKITDADLAKLEGFRDLLDDESLSNDQIADVAEVAPAVVAKARELLKHIAKDFEAPPEAEAEAEAEPARPTTPAEPEPAEPAEPAPLAVKVTARAIVIPRPMKTWIARRGDVYSGADAAFLWAEHRESVRPYPG